MEIIQFFFAGCPHHIGVIDVPVKTREFGGWGWGKHTQEYQVLKGAHISCPLLVKGSSIYNLSKYISAYKISYLNQTISRKNVKVYFFTVARRLLWSGNSVSLSFHLKE